MLAFLDSPVQLIVVMIVMLIIFGPQKLPEIGQQLGRALRELKRTTSEFTNALHQDDRYEPTYDPPRYDSYGNTYPDSASATVPEEDVYHTQTSEAQSTATASATSEPPHGDFAAAAMADTSTDYGVGQGAPAAAETGGPVYGVMAAPEKTVPRA